MGMLKEFKEFAMKGNVVDLAVAVIIGGAFGKIVSSLVADIIMPLVGLATGGVSFVDKFYSFDGKTYASLDEARKAGANVFAYGNFLTVLVNFILLAIIIFMMVKFINTLKRNEPPPAKPEAVSGTDKLLIEIRDLLKSRNA